MALIDVVTAHYRLNEAANTDNAVDAHGAMTLTRQSTPAVIGGKIAGARWLTPSGPRLFLRTNETALQVQPGSFSWCGWYFPRVSQIDFYLVSKGNLQADAFEYRLFDIAGANLMWAAGGAAIVTSPIGTTPGVWNFLAATQDVAAGQIKLSVNGAPFLTAPISTTAANTHPFVLGGYWHATLNYQNPGLDGYLDSWSYFKGYALTQDDVTALYNGGTGLDYPFTVAAGGAGKARSLLGVG